jgi:hypothetical protein
VDTEQPTERMDRNVQSWGPTTLRYVAALLWLSNVSWKVPPDFGESAETCNRLCGFVQDGIDHPVLPGTAWFFDTIVQPNLTAFGWFTLLIESTLVVLLLSGRYLRTAGVLGIVQSVGIGLAVANTPGEWYWSYILMAALSFAILILAGSLRPTTPRTMAVITVSYGVVVAIGRARNGFTGTGDGDRVLFGSGGWLANFGQNVFPGSVALGLLLIALGVGAWFVSDLDDEDLRRYTGWGTVAVAAVALATFSGDGTIIGLGSKASTAAVVAALGLSLVPSGSRTASGDPAPRSPG